MNDISLRDVTFNKVSQNTDKELCWNVFVEDINSNEIVVKNIFKFNWVVINNLINIYNEHKKNPLTFDDFSERVKKALMYEYWSRCEYETVITGWPPFIEGKEIDRLCTEKREHIEKWGNFYRTSANLSVGVKIDVYTQIMLNWEHFINYLWNNIDLIKKLKKVK